MNSTRSLLHVCTREPAGTEQGFICSKSSMRKLWKHTVSLSESKAMLELKLGVFYSFKETSSPL